MATVMPQGESIRKAVKWISEKVLEEHGKPPQRFINDAVMRFDLSPKDAEFLFEFYRSGKGELSDQK